MKVEFRPIDEEVSLQKLMDMQKSVSETSDKYVEIINGSLDKNSSALDKADAVHRFLASCCCYGNQENAIDYTAYGAIVNGKAVCQGYSSAFNVLCQKLGVKALSVYNDNHVWNVVLYEGKLYHYDTSSDDGEDSVKGVYMRVPEGIFMSDEQYAMYTLPEKWMFISE